MFDDKLGRDHFPPNSSPVTIIFSFQVMLEKQTCGGEQRRKRVPFRAAGVSPSGRCRRCVVQRSTGEDEKINHSVSRGVETVALATRNAALPR